MLARLQAADLRHCFSEDVLCLQRTQLTLFYTALWTSGVGRARWYLPFDPS